MGFYCLVEGLVLHLVERRWLPAPPVSFSATIDGPLNPRVTLAFDDADATNAAACPPIRPESLSVSNFSCTVI